jgi:hypothetical protein
MSTDARVWIAQLKAAGWTNYRGSLTNFQAPCGCIYRGPAHAWKCLKLREQRVADGLKECPNHDQENSI